MNLYYESELYHHGIKGMKWGVRRFQDKNGRLTLAGRRRYSEDTVKAQKNLQNASKNYKETVQKNRWNALISPKANNRIVDAAKKVNWAKEDLKDSKILDKVNSSNKTKRQLKLEEKYRSKGMNEKEASIAAYKQLKTERIVAAVAATSVVAISAYVAAKHYDNTVDRIIKSGTPLQNISKDSNKGVEQAFYAARTKGDKKKYVGMYGHALKSGVFGIYDDNEKVYNATAKVTSDMKIASRKSASKILSDMMNNDKSFSRDVRERIDNHIQYDPLPERKKLFQKAIKDIDNGRITKNVYDAFNITLVDHSETGNRNSSRFYDTLKKHGYDAIKDINDSKYSGYDSKDPLIVFNGKEKAKIDNIVELGNDEIRKRNKQEIGKLLGKQVAVLTGSIAASNAMALKLRDIAKSKASDKFVDTYRKEHPNTKLSYREIARMQTE